MTGKTDNSDTAWIAEIEQTIDVVSISRKARWLRFAGKAFYAAPSLLDKIRSRKPTLKPSNHKTAWSGSYEHLKINTRPV